MKLKDFSHEQAKSFTIFWTVTFSVFLLLVTWSLVFLYQLQGQDPRVTPATLWPHTVLMLIVMLSLIIGITGMWKRYFTGEFDKIREARNIAFYVVMIIVPIGIIMNLILTSIL